MDQNELAGRIDGILLQLHQFAKEMKELGADVTIKVSLRLNDKFHTEIPITADKPEVIDDWIEWLWSSINNG